MEMMKLYREHNLNPMAMGCLPMLVQFPILIGFITPSAQRRKLLHTHFCGSA